jgi:triacylglycerol esterase/lipase EstA (alpha/beta hydrolase family)
MRRAPRVPGGAGRRPHSIYLVPGFFGFANLGRLKYFRHVHDFLLAHFRALGVEAHVHVIRTHPTSTLPRRAARVLETIAATSRGARGPIHLVGHSTGGLDARLLLAPGVALPTKAGAPRHLARVRSVVTVATPHHGSPLASFLATIRGQRLLALLSVGTAYVLRFGHLPLSVAVQLATLFAPGEGSPLQRTLLDGVVAQLLADFSIGRRRAVSRLLVDVASDQSLLVQLMPEAMQVFSAAVRERSGVRYGSVVTRAARPGVRSTIATGLDPGAQAMHAVYQALYRIVAGPARVEPPALTAAQARALRRAYGSLPGAPANDGIVPTRSQVFGEVIAALDADHLDVIGHFSDATTRPPHYDWLTTGSGFDRAQFESAWRRVAAFLLESDQDAV